MEFDIRHRSTRWIDVTKTEMEWLNEYDNFNHLGKDSLASLRYKKIQIHLVYDVKYDGRHNSSLVADGHLTYISVEIVYSRVFFLRGCCC